MRPKSPRPQTLPFLGIDGMPEGGFAAKIPGHEKGFESSPIAPQQVRAFAESLVDVVFADMISKKVIINSNSFNVI